MADAVNDKDRKRILLIDDDTSLLVTLSDFLSFEGYNVITADSGEEGLKALEEMPPPDLIVLDMSMPGMGGMGFLRSISTGSGRPAYPVLVLTARANMAEFFADVEVDGFVAKPCDPNDLLMEIGRIIFLRSGTMGEGAAVEKKVLILGEDRELLNRNLTESLSQAGYMVHPAARGPEVIEKAILERPHAIVLRANLAGLAGKAVADMLKQMVGTRGVPVVIYEATESVSGESIRGALSGCEPEAIIEALAGVFTD